MKHSISHDLNLADAREVADKALESYQAKLAKYEPKVDWVSEKRADISFKAKGISISGYIELADKAMDVDLDVPFILRPFKAKAISVIEEEVNDWVDKKKRGEL